MTTEPRHTTPVKAVWAEGRTPENEWVIGNSHTNGLPWPPQPEDLHHFRDETRGHVLVMGRKTFESLPAVLKQPESTKRRPLVILTSNLRTAYGIIDQHPGNANIQPLCFSQGVSDTGLRHSASVVLAAKWPDKPVAIIGGARVIELFQPWYEKMVVSHVRPFDADIVGDVLAPGDSFYDGWTAKGTARGLGPSFDTYVYTYTRKELA